MNSMSEAERMCVKGMKKERKGKEKEKGRKEKEMRRKGWKFGL